MTVLSLSFVVGVRGMLAPGDQRVNATAGAPFGRPSVLRGEARRRAVVDDLAVGPGSVTKDGNETRAAIAPPFVDQSVYEWLG
jgi:hypothetical protein